MKKIEYLWHINNDEIAQFWEKHSTQQYLSVPTKNMPKEFINADNNILVPEPLPFDVLAMRSIVNAGRTKHPAGYYHSRQRNKYSVVVFVLSGKISIKLDNSTRILSKGDILLVPAGCTCDESVKNGDVTVFWLHIKKTPDWELGSNTRVVSSKYFDDIVRLLTMYLSEVFATTRSTSLLGNIADIVVEYLKRVFELQPPKLSKAEIDNYVARVYKTPQKKWSRSEVAKFFKCTPNKLDNIFTQLYGHTFSKFVKNIRIKKAFELIESGEKDFAKIASKVGYANANSLSKAFKAQLGESLRNILKNKL